MADLATLEAGLAAGLTEEEAGTVCIIDGCTREIFIPDDLAVAGVESDDSTHTIKICVPRHPDDGVDLNNFTAYINYINGNSEKAAYCVPTSAIEATEETLTLKWRLSRLVLAKKGAIRFSVCFRMCNISNEVIKEWNSTVATLTVLEGLEADVLDVTIVNDAVKEAIELAVQQVTDSAQEAQDAANSASQAAASSASQASAASQAAANSASQASAAAQRAESTAASVSETYILIKSDDIYFATGENELYHVMTAESGKAYTVIDMARGESTNVAHNCYVWYKINGSDDYITLYNNGDCFSSPNDTPYSGWHPSWSMNSEGRYEVTFDTVEFLAHSITLDSVILVGSQRAITKTRYTASEAYEKIVAPLEGRMNTFEQTINSNEAGRVAFESQRVIAETGRVNAENSRVSAESARASAESSRVIAESARATAESNRVSAESSRASAESARASAEASRVAAEVARQATIDTLNESYVDLASASSSDIGKALSPKTVANGKVTEWQYKTIPTGGGSGSGSVVEVTQIQATGTKIAEISVDGDAKEIYIPSDLAKTSDIPTSDINANTSARHTHTNKAYLDGLTDDHINSLIDTKLGSFEGGGSGGLKLWENNTVLSEGVNEMSLTLPTTTDKICMLSVKIYGILPQALESNSRLDFTFANTYKAGSTLASGSTCFSFNIMFIKFVKDIYTYSLSLGNNIGNYLQTAINQFPSNLLYIGNANNHSNVVKFNFDNTTVFPEGTIIKMRAIYE